MVNVGIYHLKASHGLSCEYILKFINTARFCQERIAVRAFLSRKNGDGVVTNMKTSQRILPNGTARNGFSLSEMLLVVAIIAILAAVGFINGADMIRGSRQTAMDRQAEQIFLAISRNLQGMEASGNTQYLAETVKNIYETDSPSWLFPLVEPKPLEAGKYAFYQDGSQSGNAFETFGNLLFPQDGLSAALSADLENGCLLVLFTPGMDDESEITKNVGGISVKEGTETRNVRPAVYQVFFAQNEESAKQYFEKLLKYTDAGEASDISRQTVEKGAAYYGGQTEGRTRRLNELYGYVGYYGGDSDQ